MQSKPSVWLSFTSVRAVRDGPMCCRARPIDTATAFTPAAWSSGSETVSFSSST